MQICSDSFKNEITYKLIIILSCHQHGYPWPSLATPPYRSSLPVGPHGYLRILTELLYVGSSWPLCFCTAMWKGPLEYITYELFLLLHQCPACLVRLTWIVFVMGGRWPYSYCFVGFCLQDLFNIARSILVEFPSSFFSSRLVSVHVVHPYSSIDMIAAWKKLCFKLLTYKSCV